MRYAHRRGDDGDLRSRLREIALERRRFGYRRLGIMLAREGLVMNHKKLLRLYREENLRVRRRRGRKRAMGTRAPMTLSIGVQKGPPIGVQKGPRLSSGVTGMAGVPFALVAA